MIVDCPECERRHVVLDRAPGTPLACDCGHTFTLTQSAFASGVFKCANCGSNPPVDAQHCPYCDAHLTNRRCTRCLANGVEGDRHCRACGHPVDAPAPQSERGPDAVLECPRCDVAMRAVLVGDALIDECTSCGGLWLAHSVFEGLIQSSDQEALYAAVRRLRPGKPDAPRGRPETETRFYVRCPQCEVLMQRRQFAKVSGVVVDVCDAHGLWFDHDELPAIVRFVREGGLEKALETLHQKRVAAIADAARKSQAQARSNRRTLSRSLGGSAVEVALGVLAALVR